MQIGNGKDFDGFRRFCSLIFMGMKLLIIDDERSIRNTLKEILEFEGHTVDVAEDGAVGLEMAGQKKYDAIFCDIKMPNMDGVEFLEKFAGAGHEEPVIIRLTLTGYS